MSVTPNAARTDPAGNEFSVVPPPTTPSDIDGVPDAGQIAQDRPAKSTRDSRSPLGVAVIALGAIGLVSDIIGIAQWPQTPMVWIMIVTGVVALLLGLPAVWIWHTRTPRTLRTDVFFALAVIMSLLGASFVSGGVVALGHGPLGAIAAASGGSQHSGKAGSVVRQDKIGLNIDYQIDLDSKAQGWGVLKVDSSINVPTEPDLQLTYQTLEPINGAQLALSSDISYAGCADATKYGDKLSSDSADIKTATFCVKTNGGHFAGLRVTSVSIQNMAADEKFFVTIELSVTVW